MKNDIVRKSAHLNVRNILKSETAIGNLSFTPNHTTVDLRNQNEKRVTYGNRKNTCEAAFGELLCILCSLF